MSSLLLGALASAGSGLASNLFGGGDGLRKVNNFSPQQKKVFNDFLSQITKLQQGGYGKSMGLLEGFLDPNSDQYKNFEQPYINQFNQQTLPNIAERFAGAGALSSSAFGQSLGAAGSDLQTNLASLKSQIQQDAIGKILGQYNNMIGTGLSTNPFDYQRKGASMGSTFMQGLSNISPQVYSDIFRGFGKQGNNQNGNYPLTSGYENLFRTGAAY